jgi:hypothetical protein
VTCTSVIPALQTVHVGITDVHVTIAERPPSHNKLVEI